MLCDDHCKFNHFREYMKKVNVIIENKKVPSILKKPGKNVLIKCQDCEEAFDTENDFEYHYKNTHIKEYINEDSKDTFYFSPENEMFEHNYADPLANLPSEEECIPKNEVKSESKKVDTQVLKMI